MADGFSVEAQALVEAFRSEVSALRASIQAGFEPTTAYDKKTGPLVVALDLRGAKGRLQMELWVKSSGPAVFMMEGSRNGQDWHQVDAIALDAAGERHQGYMNAYPVIRVSTDAPGENEIEIVAAR
ncbi:MAG: hypothetical protein AAB303_04125 [Chloroflexota bacterium]